MSIKKEVLNSILNKTAEFQSNLEKAVQNGDSGRHQISVQLVKGRVKKVQVFSENSEELE